MALVTEVADASGGSGQRTTLTAADVVKLTDLASLSACEVDAVRESRVSTSTVYAVEGKPKPAI